MEKIRMNVNQKEEKILNELYDAFFKFDFEEVAEVFKKMNYTYGFGRSEHIPDVYELKKTVHELIMGISKKGSFNFAGSGRFEVGWRKIGFRNYKVYIHFVPVEEDNW